MQNLTGQSFNFLMVLELDHIKKYGKPNPQTKPYWKCKCSCGEICVVRAEHLKSGATISCGCMAKNNASTHGMNNTRVYHIWASMKTRSDPKYKEKSSYEDVTRCKRWDSFENFYKDMGEPPTVKHTLDRIDPFGNYEPLNCRWATRSEQALNLRKNAHLWEFYSREDRPVSFSLFRTRLRNGWDIDKSASHPKMKNQFI